MIVKYFIGPLKKHFVMTTNCNQKRTDTKRYRVTLYIDVILPAEFVARNVPVL